MRKNPSPTTPNLLELEKSHHIPRKVTRFQVAVSSLSCTCLSGNLKVEGRGKNKE
jgi:hypothetical protein